MHLVVWNTSENSTALISLLDVFFSSKHALIQLSTCVGNGSEFIGMVCEETGNAIPALKGHTVNKKKQR